MSALWFFLGFLTRKPPFVPLITVTGVWRAPVVAAVWAAPVRAGVWRAPVVEGRWAAPEFPGLWSEAA